MMSGPHRGGGGAVRTRPRRRGGRIPGWTVQAMERLGNDILIRPRLLYTGPEARDHVSIETWGRVR